MVLTRPGVTDIKIGLHVGPLAEIAVQIGMGVAVTILAVNIAYGPGGVFNVTGRDRINGHCFLKVVGIRVIVPDKK
jgi:hypothetical protein